MTILRSVASVCPSKVRFSMVFEMWSVSLAKDNNVCLLPFFWLPILLHTQNIKVLFPWICWFDSWKFHFYKNWKTQIILFGYKTHHKNSYPICFMIGDMYIVSAIICYFWFVAFLSFLSSQKMKSVKYNFWLQKEVKSHIQFVFSIRDSSIWVVSFAIFDSLSFCYAKTWKT